MATGMALGQNVDVRGSQLTVHNPYSDFASLRDEGRRYNVMAATAGAIAGAALISGVSLVVVAALERKRAKREIGASARLRPTLTGLELRF